MASLTYDLTLAGLAVGSAAALTGIGLIVTYRATGVLNFAHGAVAMVCAYVLRQLTVEWNWPLWLAATVTLLLIAPGIGLLLERAVFRPLSVLGGDPAQTLVASIGVFVLLVGGAALLWGPGARSDAPRLLPAEPWGQLAAALALAAGVAAVTRWTRFGGELRAVVDNRRLAVLGGIDADRVAAAGWAFGSFTAGLTGVLLAPSLRLDPYGLPLLVMEVMAVAVGAGMSSLPVAVTVALGLGVVQAQLTRLHPEGWGEPLLQAVGANLFVVALLVAALVLPGIGGRAGDALRRTATARVATPPWAWLVAGVLFLLPLGFAGSDLHTAVQVPALAVVLLSLVVVTGRGGQISLGQAAYAGLGALFTALLAEGRFPGLPALPHLPALGVAVVLVAPLGLLTGRPAIRRHGLALALATFAVGVAVSRFVFAQPYATAGLGLARPAGFGSDRAYYVLELALLTGSLLAVAALRRGRTGRALAAMRDHEAGAAAAGIPVPRLKLGAFVAGAALAALGGGMLGMGLRAFDPAAFDPVRGLLWFAAIVVLGADSLIGALIAAALLVGLDAGTRGGVAAAAIGILAVLLGRFPGGPYEALRTATRAFRPRTTARLTPLGANTRARLALLPSAVRTSGSGTLESEGRPGARREGWLSAGRAGGGGSGARAGGEQPEARAGDERSGARTEGGQPGARAGGDQPEAQAGGKRSGARTEGGQPGAGDGQPGARTEGEQPGARAGGDQPEARAGGERSEARAGGERSGARTEGGQPEARAGGEQPGAGPDPGPTASGSRPLPTPDTTPTPPPDATAPSPHPGTTTRTPPPVTPNHRPPGPSSPPHPTPILSARNLALAYGGFTVLDGVDLEVMAGRVTAVVGPNGAGKSTLFHCLAGTVRPDAGRVEFRGRDVTALPAHARTRLGIARTFQQLAVFPSLTVAETVRVGAEQGRVRDEAAARRALALLGLDGPVGRLPAAELPTGTLRRVELGRALAGSPHVLLLDEPAAGLDTDEVAELSRVLRALAADGMALLVVEHDLDLVDQLADTVRVLAAGRVVASGPADRVLDTLGQEARPQPPGPRHRERPQP